MRAKAAFRQTYEAHQNDEASPTDQGGIDA
jgi:hypothetical protein